MSALCSPGALGPARHIQPALCKLTQLSSSVLGKLYIGLVFLLEEVLKAVVSVGEDLLSGN